MITHCYTIEYNDTIHASDSEALEHLFISRYHTNAGMYALGDKYGIESLKVAAKRKFDEEWANTHPTPPLDDLYNVIPYIWASTPESDRGLRDMVVSLAQHNTKHFSKHPSFKTWIAENVDFVADYMSRDLR